MSNSLSFVEKSKTFETFFKPDNPFLDILIRYQKYVFSNDKQRACQLILDESNNGMDIKDIYKYIIQPFQSELGLQWHRNEINVAQEHYATAISQFAMTLLYDRIFSVPKNNNTILGTCVQGELHEFGIRMVCDFMESCGWNTYYLGANMPNSSIIASINELNPSIIAISCTMSYNVSPVKELIYLIKNEGIKIPIMVGGYPFIIEKDLWKKVEADAFSVDFEEAMEVATNFVTEH